MEKNIQAVHYIYLHFHFLEQQDESELMGKQKTLKQIANFMKEISCEKVTSEQRSFLTKAIQNLTSEELRIAIRAILIYEGDVEYPTDIQNHSVLDGEENSYSASF